MLAYRLSSSLEQMKVLTRTRTVSERLLTQVYTKALLGNSCTVTISSGGVNCSSAFGGAEVGYCMLATASTSAAFIGGSGFSAAGCCGSAKRLAMGSDYSLLSSGSSAVFGIFRGFLLGVSSSTP